MPTNRDQNDSDIDAILAHLVTILPVLHRRILRMDLGGSTGEITRLHLGVMATLSVGKIQISELARAALVHKPQMTRIVDQLEKHGFVRRIADPSDRRATNIELTESGRVMLDQLKQKIHSNLKEALSSLTADELAEMSVALDTLVKIVSRL